MSVINHACKLLLIAALLGGCEQSSNNKTLSSPKSSLVADVVYSGGDILTMEGETPQYTEALAIKDGKIAYVGDRAGAEALIGSTTKKVDLVGQTLLPGFIDAHGHVWNTGVQAMAANLLPPPDGEGRDIATLINITKDWAAKSQQAIDTTGWIIGFGYDDAQLKEGRHPTADDLDQISTTTPVLFLHQSTHLGVMNHKGLELAGYNAETPDPAGGVIRRKPGSQEPNGVLEEMALFTPLFALLAEFDEEANLAIARAGLKAYAAEGFTTAQEGRATKSVAEAWRKLAEQGELFLDVDVYPDIRGEDAYMRQVGSSSNYTNGFRIAGVKLSLDGAIQNYTGWLTKSYHETPPEQQADYRGYPAVEDDQEVARLVDMAYQHQWPLLVHTNGDAASDQLIGAVRKATDKHGKADRRTVMIHAQTVREDQLDIMKELGIFPSFFAMHTYYWGDLHRKTTLGKKRAWRISPAQSALRRGMRFSQHHDAPVALPSAMAVLSASVNRTSRSGVVIGPEQRISPYDALRAITIWAAYQGFQENRKGNLKVGKLADLVILDRNPLKVKPESLRELKVMETIKQGQTIYQAKATEELSGSAMYRERMALPEGSEFEATLLDTSRADVAAEVIGQVRFAAPAGPPIRFSIPYDPSRIDSKHQYAVRARIVHQDQLLFTTDMHYPVLTGEAPETVEVLLHRVPEGNAVQPTQSETLYGMYRYTAGAGWFTECGSGQRLPVAQEGDNAKLEEAYVDTAHDSDAILLAVVKGRVEEREPMEGGPRAMLIVERFQSLKPGSCDHGSSASLENTYWKVMSIQEKPVIVSEGQREPHLILHPDEHRVSGHGGCNRITGTYEFESDQIQFMRMAGTMMACSEGMEQEQALHQALGAVVRWQISGQRLKLYDKESSVLLELESRYLD